MSRDESGPKRRVSPLAATHKKGREKTISNAKKLNRYTPPSATVCPNCFQYPEDCECDLIAAAADDAMDQDFPE